MLVLLSTGENKGWSYLLAEAEVAGHIFTYIAREDTDAGVNDLQHSQLLEYTAMHSLQVHARATIPQCWT